MSVGVLCSRVRVEEKLLFEAMRERGIEYEVVDVRQVALGLAEDGFSGYDVVLIRCLSDSRALYAARVLNGHGIPTDAERRQHTHQQPSVKITRRFTQCY